MTQLLRLFLLTSVFLLPGVPNSSAKMSFQYKASQGAWTLYWGGNEGIAKEKNGKTRPLFKGLFRIPSHCKVESRFNKVLSFVGSMVSVSGFVELSCGGMRRRCLHKVRTIDLNSGKQLDLSSLVSPKVLMTSLRKDGYLRRYIKYKNGDTLATLLQRNRPILGELTKQFAFHHIHTSRPHVAAVRLFLPIHNRCSGKQLQLGMYFSFPTHKASLRRAKRKKHFMKTLSSSAKQPGTSFLNRTHKQIYSQYFKRSHTSDFDEPNLPQGNPPQIKVGERQFATFRGGFLSLLGKGRYTFTASLSALYNLNNDPDKVFKHISGVSPTLTSPSTYRRYHPSFLRWVSQHFIPAPEETLHGVSYKKIYKYIFKRFFRMLAASYLDLKHRRGFEKEWKAYQRALKKDKRAGVSHLQSAFAKALETFHSKQSLVQTTSSNPMEPFHVYGFWLRRHSHGNAVLCWKILEKHMKHFDGKWLDNARKRFEKK